MAVATFRIQIAARRKILRLGYCQRKRTWIPVPEEMDNIFSPAKSERYLKVVRLNVFVVPAFR